MKSLLNVTILFSFALASFFTMGEVTEPKVLIFNIADVPKEEPFEGVISQRIYTDTVWIPVVTIKRGASSGHHNHPDEQTMMIQSGRVQAFIGNKEYILGKDDIMIIPSYVPHHFKALEDSHWIEVHGPGFKQREFDPDSWDTPQ